MGQFWLIQRGKLNKNGGPTLTGKNGTVNLDYMGSAEFEFGAIPAAYRRIMHDFGSYETIDAGVDVAGGRRLILFAKKENSPQIAEEIRYFVDHPYQLQEYSELEKLTEVADITWPITICRTRFWWCIDRGDIGDWMAFLKEDGAKILRAINYDLNNWWLKKPEVEREEEYKQATHGFPWMVCI